MRSDDLFRWEVFFAFLSRFGGDLLSHVLRRSTIGATALNGRVRDGTGCFARAMTTKPRKKHAPRMQLSLHGGASSVFCCSKIAFEVRQPCCFWIKSSLSGN